MFLKTKNSQITTICVDGDSHFATQTMMPLTFSPFKGKGLVKEQFSKVGSRRQYVYFKTFFSLVFNINYCPRITLSSYFITSCNEH
jgi:hypothetical protein